MTRGAALRLLAAAVACVALPLLADRLFPPDLSRLHASALILLDHDGNLLDGHVSHDGAWRLPATAASVDPAYLRLLLRTEDRRFNGHPGIDALAMGRAVLQRLGRGRIVSGGSTLAMQAARLLAPHPHDLRGKLSDMLRALQLEWRYGRAGVLGIYLTLAPEGGNVEGLRAASLLLFGHEPAHLTPREAALLVALPRRPARLDPARLDPARPDPARLDPARAPVALEAAARSVLARAGWPVPADMHAPWRRTMPHDAPHLLASVAQDGRSDVVRTTIDAGLQRGVTLAARGAVPPPHGEYAALVLRRDRSVAAWLGGSAGPGDAGVGGAGVTSSCAGNAVDMIRARRSPGSALKPFIYGLAFGDAVLTPETLLDDRRMRLGNYAPHDFDRGEHGIVTAAEALRQSYNLPAVAVLQRVGPSRFAAALGNAGIHLALPAGAAPTLALALGGDALSAADLAALYASLVRDGRVAPLRLLADAPDPRGVPLLSASAAHSVLGVLAANPPPDGTAAGSRLIAYKTGTSYGERDAWAAGVSPGWTVVVWAGRPDGTPVPGLTGRGTAAPLMERLFELLPPDGGQSGFVAPPAVAARSLSPALRRYHAAGRGPQIVYPPPGSAIESRRADGTMTPVGLEASGGRPPYRWRVDGAPLTVLPGGEPGWVPDGIGFAHVSVTDDDDRSAAVELRIR